MLHCNDEHALTITRAALKAVQDILTQRNLDGYALRVFVSGNGCCGSQFGMTLDKNILDTDTTFEMDGINVIVDEMSIDQLRDISIDFIDDPQRGSGFLINNPHIETSCAGGEDACSSCT